MRSKYGLSAAAMVENEEEMAGRGLRVGTWRLHRYEDCGKRARFGIGIEIERRHA